MDKRLVITRVAAITIAITLSFDLVASHSSLQAIGTGSFGIIAAIAMGLALSPDSVRAIAGILAMTAFFRAIRFLPAASSENLNSAVAMRKLTSAWMRSAAECGLCLIIRSSWREINIPRNAPPPRDRSGPFGKLLLAIRGLVLFLWRLLAIAATPAAMKMAGNEVGVWKRFGLAFLMIMQGGGEPALNLLLIGAEALFSMISSLMPMDKKLSKQLGLSTGVIVCARFVHAMWRLSQGSLDWLHPSFAGKIVRIGTQLVSACGHGLVAVYDESREKEKEE